mgnify:CR=1 FL=1
MVAGSRRLRLLASEPPLLEAAEQHADHLHVQKADADLKQLVVRHAELSKAGDANDAEEHQVVEVHEVYEGGYDDDHGKKLTRQRRRR